VIALMQWLGPMIATHETSIKQLHDFENSGGLALIGK
jgi:hypothetical protein